jgi:Scaffold protein Nfu/NifU N terminal
MKCQFEFYPNPNRMCVHLSQRLSDDRAVTFWHKSHNVDEQPSYVLKIFEIDGITEVTLQQYSISLEKGSVFEWEDILFEVINVLNKDFALLDDDKIWFVPLVNSASSNQESSIYEGLKVKEAKKKTPPNDDYDEDGNPNEESMNFDEVSEEES